MTDFSPRGTTEASPLELTAVLAQMGAVVLAAETIDTTIELVTTLWRTRSRVPAGPG